MAACKDFVVRLPQMASLPLHVGAMSWSSAKANVIGRVSQNLQARVSWHMLWRLLFSCTHTGTSANRCRSRRDQQQLGHTCTSKGGDLRTNLHRRASSATAVYLAASGTM